MTEETSARTSDKSAQLDQAILEYLKAEETGRPIERAEWLARHPNLAGELSEFLANREDLQRKLISNDVVLEPTVVATSLGPIKSVESGDRIRYVGDYEIVRELGRGGMGVVYLARQMKLDRLVALKIVLTGRLASAKDVARFQAEAEAVAALDHPRIVPIYEVGEVEGCHFFSMKYLTGQTFSDWLKERRPARDARIEEKWKYYRQAATLLAEVAETVAYAHERGIIHRDLKPANILLQPIAQESETPSTTLPGEPCGVVPYVTDFGLAKRQEHGEALTQSGTIAGTPAYMAPEQCGGAERSITVRTDVYALGAMLYEVLTGEPPHRGDDLFDTLKKVVEEAPVPPRDRDRKAPRELEAVCLKCLEKSPGARYQSADAVAGDHRAWLDGRQVSVRQRSLAGKLGYLLGDERWRRLGPAKLVAYLAFTTSVSSNTPLVAMLFVVVPSLWGRLKVCYDPFPSLSQPLLLQIPWPTSVGTWLTIFIGIIVVVPFVNFLAIGLSRYNSARYREFIYVFGFLGLLGPTIVVLGFVLGWGIQHRTSIHAMHPLYVLASATDRQERVGPLPDDRDQWSGQDFLLGAYPDLATLPAKERSNRVVSKTMADLQFESISSICIPLSFFWAAYLAFGVSFMCYTWLKREKRQIGRYPTRATATGTGIVVLAQVGLFWTYQFCFFAIESENVGRLLLILVLMAASMLIAPVVVLFERLFLTTAYANQK